MGEVTHILTLWSSPAEANMEGLPMFQAMAFTLPDLWPSSWWRRRPVWRCQILISEFSVRARVSALGHATRADVDEETYLHSH